MTTTIKISKANQTRLFQIKNQLEKEMNIALSYNDVVDMLLNKLQNIDVRQLMDDLTSIKGILNKEDKNYYKRMRKIDQNSENRFLSN